MNFTVTNNSISPYLHVGDEIEFYKGKPLPNGRICFVKYQEHEKIRQLFNEGGHYRLQCLNPICADRTETWERM